MSANDAACAAQFVPLETSCEQGACNPVTGACECRPDWVNFGDFSLNRRGACDIYLPAVKGLWSLQIAVSIASILYACRLLHKRWKLGIIFDKKTWRVGLVPFGAIAASTASIIMGSLKISSPIEYSVGNSAGMVALSGLFITFVSCSLLLGLLVLMVTSMNLLPSQSEHLFKLKENYVHVRRAINVIAVVGLILIWAPIMMLFDQNLTEAAAIILGVGLSSMMFLIGSCLASIFMLKLIAGIEDTLRLARESERSNSQWYIQLKSVYLKLRVARYFQLVGFFLASVVLMVFCCIPFLVKKASYLYPLAFFAGVAAVDILMWTQNNAPKRPRRGTARASQTGKPDVTDHDFHNGRKTGYQTPHDKRDSLKTVEI